MSEPVVIGIREVYDEVVKLRSRFDEATTADRIKAALLEQRVGQLEKSLGDERARKWALYVALIGAFVAIVMGTLAIVLK